MLPSREIRYKNIWRTCPSWTGIPKITLNLLDAHQNGNVVWYYLDFMFPNGPSGHAGVTAVNDAGLWHIAMHVANATPPKQQQ
jgi:hypothetical protein